MLLSTYSRCVVHYFGELSAGPSSALFDLQDSLNNGTTTMAYDLSQTGCTRRIPNAHVLNTQSPCERGSDSPATCYKRQMANSTLNLDAATSNSPINWLASILMITGRSSPNSSLVPALQSAQGTATGPRRNWLTGTSAVLCQTSSHSNPKER